MANNVILRFLGDDGPLARTLKRVEGQANSLGRGLGGLTRSVMALGAAGSGVQGIAALGTSLAQMSGAALLAPAGILATGAALTTVKLAAQGFSDALGGDEGALARLAPSARATATELIGLKDQWKSVQQTVQQNVFADVAGDVRELGGTYLPVLRNGLGQIGTAFNNIARNALGALKTPQAVASVDKVLTATGASLGRMGEALGDLVSGFLNLAGAGAEFLGRTGSGLVNLTARFDAWTQRITSDGSFERWVTSAGQAFSQLFAVIGNLGAIVTTVISGLSGPTEGLFASLERVTGSIRAFLESAQGQDALASLGSALQTASQALGQVLDAGLREIGPLIQAAAPVVAELATAIGGALVAAITTVGPLLTGFADFLASTPGSATALLGVLAALWASFQVGRAVIAATSVVSGVMAAWPTIVAAATGAWTAAQWLLNAALSANPIGLVVIAIAALVAGLIWAWNSSETFRNIVLGVWEAVKSAIGAAVDWIVNAISWFSNLPSMVGGWFASMATAAIGKVTELVGWLRGLPGRILQAVGNLGSLLLSAGRDLLTGLWNGIAGAAGWLRDRIAGFFRNLLPGWAKDFLGIRSPSRVFADEVGRYIPDGVAVGITTNTDSLISAARQMGDAARAAATDGLGDMVRWGEVDAATWDRLLAQGWRGRANDGIEAIYRPAQPVMQAPQQMSVEFAGNVDSAFATAFMKLVRSGDIQVVAR